MADRFARGNRKEKQWAFMGKTEFTLTADVVTFGGRLDFTEKSTVIRILCEYMIAPTSAPAALDAINITLGLAKVSTDAVNVGASALPDPAGQPQFPWLFWAEHAFYYSSTDPESASAAASGRFPIDIRSMRKFSPRETLVWVVQYVNASGNPPMRVHVAQTRVLRALS